MFGSAHFRKTFLIRFLGYFSIQIGLIVLALIVEPVTNEELRYRVNNILNRHYTVPKVVTSVNPEGAAPPQDKGGPSSFGDLLMGGSSVIVPVSTDFGIVIEKIGANARVIANVDPSNERDYTSALAQGVAHSKGTVYPGQKGNIYLFSHSTDAPWNIVRYNAIFYLLGKLEAGDRVVMFYQGRRFDYIVFDKQIVDPGNTEYLTNVYDESVLTLQTCDPPGTLLHRLIVRAKLASG